MDQHPDARKNSKSLDEIYRESLGEPSGGWGRPRPAPEPWSDPWRQPLAPPGRDPFAPAPNAFPQEETERARFERHKREREALERIFNPKPSAPAPAPAAQAPSNPLGSPTARDALLAQTLGSRGDAFEKAFGASLLALLIDEAKRARSVSPRLADQLNWAIETSASLELLAKAMPLAPLEIMRLGDSGLAAGARLIEMGLRLPSEVAFQSASGRKARGSILHALFSASYANCPQLPLIARVLATPERLTERDSEGYSVCGRLNLELSCAGAHKPHLLAAFEALVALGADPTDLAPGAATLAADPAIARAAEVELERKALEAASRARPSPGAAPRL